MLKKITGWIIIAFALGCFVLTIITIAAVFGKDVALIVTLSLLGFGALGIGNKMIG